MGKIVGLNGQVLNPEPSERTQPMMLLDAADGKFSIPVVVLADMQYKTLVDEITGNILEQVLPLLHEQLELPLETK